MDYVEPVCEFMEEEVEELEDFEEVEVIEKVEEVEASPQYMDLPHGIRLPPQAPFNEESSRPVVSDVGCATTTLNASSFKGYGAGASKT